jgi:hypothetical protein
MTTLSKKSIYLTTPPAIPLNFVQPLSYEFRVAEIIDESGKIESVKLQMCIWEHDEHGVGTMKQSWSDVPRYKFDKSGKMLPS